jgi:hypothetical protein
MLEVKSVERLLGTPLPYAYAVKAGPWIFMTGHEAYDWATGISDEVAGPPGFPLYGRSRSRREGDFILQRMQKLLGEFGSDLAHSIRLDQYYPNPKAVAAYHLSRHAEFRDYIPPSTSVVMERCCCAEATISTSLILSSAAQAQAKKERAVDFPYVDGPLLARCFCSALIRSLAPICPACLCART